MIIGLTGPNASGKGVVASHLIKRGFVYLSLSDILREELTKRGERPERESLYAFGNELRRKKGPGILAEKILERITTGDSYVIDSIRHPSEANVLRRLSGFHLVCVDAPIEVRFERIRRRGREKDPTTFAYFLELEKRELEGGGEDHQQLAKTMRTADYVIRNDGTLDELREKVDMMISELSDTEKSNTRPSWDDYFMGIARVVAARSNCIRRKVAAIIVVDKRIISTGYNGTPRGTRNCDEGGCPRCSESPESGRRLDECLCSHGEENAIVQAAYHGISVKGGVLYSTCSPCLICTKMIINAGISEVVYNEEYPLADASLALLREAGVEAREILLAR